MYLKNTFNQYTKYKRYPSLILNISLSCTICTVSITPLYGSSNSTHLVNVS